jgi:hypothetical protein
MKRTARITGRLIAGDEALDVSGEIVYQSAELLVISPPFRGALAAELDAYQAFMEGLRWSPLLHVDTIDGSDVAMVLDVRMDVGSARVGDDERIVFGVDSGR